MKLVLSGSQGVSRSVQCAEALGSASPQASAEWGW